ncbi:hypothetical protein [Nocardia aurantia]|uniref:Uncharacterized protein n=1 Tax=Nocardia aurantia TaxID=2585199 RepID=A0A7K0DQQ5_9NOCA|nr:hypothetical protein [Nocardia aurantia]MQY27692.1 hypothetical protein [Nocardia aurantia]
MNPALPQTFNLLRRALAGTILATLLGTALLTAAYYATGGWAAAQLDAMDTVRQWQFTISHLVPFPWQ